MPAREPGSFFSIVDGTLNSVLVSDLDHQVLKQLVADYRGLILLDLKQRSEYSSITTTSGEYFDEQDTPAVRTAVPDADDHLSRTASSIPPVDPNVFTMKHSAFLEHLLMEEVDLGGSTPGRSHDHAMVSIRAADGPTGQVPCAESSPNKMPPETMGRIKKRGKRKRNFHAEEDFAEIRESMNLHPRLSKRIHKYQEVFEALPSPRSCKIMVQMDFKLKPEVEGSVLRWRHYPAPQDHIDKIGRQIEECIDAGLAWENKHADYPCHCSPCFLIC